MLNQISLNRSGKIGGGPPSDLPVYPPLVELRGTLGIPYVSQFSTYMIAANPERFHLITMEDYFSLDGPPYDAVYVLLCSDDAAHPSQCKVVHFVARVLGISRGFEMEGVGNMCSAYLSLVIQAGQPPEIAHTAYPQLMNIRVPERIPSNDMVFRPSYDRTYSSPDTPDFISARWSYVDAELIYQGSAPGVETPVYETRIDPGFGTVSMIDATELKPFSCDDLIVGALRLTVSGEGYLQISRLFDFVAVTTSADQVTDFCWTALHWDGAAQSLKCKLILASDPVHPVGSMSAGTPASVANIAAAIATMYKRIKP